MLKEQWTKVHDAIRRNPPATAGFCVSVVRLISMAYTRSNFVEEESVLDGPHPKDKPLDEFEAYYRDLRLKPRKLEGLAGFVDSLISIQLAVSLVGIGLIVVLVVLSGVASN